jgi:hypothetical protein
MTDGQNPNPEHELTEPETREDGLVDETREPPGGSSDDPAALRREAAQRRRQLRDTEKERDRWRSIAGTQQRTEVERQAAERFADPRDVWSVTMLIPPDHFLGDPDGDGVICGSCATVDEIAAWMNGLELVERVLARGE